MSRRGDHEFLLDIQEALHRIAAYTQGLAFEKFRIDSKTQDAVVRNLEIVGEAVKNISDDLKNRYSHIAWSDLAKVRDKLIHHYFGVNFDIVWSIIQDDLPAISSQITELLQKDKR